MLYVVKFKDGKGVTVFESQDAAIKFRDQMVEKGDQTVTVEATDGMIRTVGGETLDASKYDGTGNHTWQGLRGKRARQYKKQQAKIQQKERKKKEVWKARRPGDQASAQRYERPASIRIMTPCR